jgi:hypothetical protein
MDPTLSKEQGLAGLLPALRPEIEITLVSTPRLLASLSIPPVSPPIRLHMLPFAPTEHGLPPDADSLTELQSPPVHHLLRSSSPASVLRPS